MHLKQKKNFKDNIFLEWKRWQDELKLITIHLKNMKLMRSVNPLVIPRNRKIEEVLNDANNNNIKPFKEFLEILKNP